MSEEKRPSNATPTGDQIQASPDLTARLDAAASDLKRLAASIRGATKAGRRNRPKTLELLDSAKKLFERLRAIERECEDAASKWREVGGKEWLEIDASVKDMCKRHGWRVDGSWPSYLVAYGVQLEFDDKTKSVQVAGQGIDGDDLEGVELALNGQITQLIPKEFAPGGFLELLASAYEDAKRRSSQVPILDVYKAVVVRSQRPGFWRNAKNEKFVGLSVDQFRARLSKTLEANVLKTKAGLELRFFPPLDPKDALFLYNPIERRLGFVGRIEFAGGLV